MPTQMEVCLVAEEKTVQKLRVVLNTLAYRQAKLIAFCFVGLSLRLKNMHFVGKQFQITVDNSTHISPGNTHLLRGDCSNWSLASWTWAGTLAVNFAPQWPLLLLTILPVFLNFSTKHVIVCRWGIFLPEYSRRNCLWTSVDNFLAKYSSTLFLLFSTENCSEWSSGPSW